MEEIYPHTNSKLIVLNIILLIYKLDPMITTLAIKTTIKKKQSFLLTLSNGRIQYKIDFHHK